VVALKLEIPLIPASDADPVPAWPSASGAGALANA